MNALVWSYLDQLIDPLINPQKRVFLGYLGSALVLAICVQVFFVKTSLPGAIREIFARRIWFSTSARADYKILLFNKLIMMGVVPWLVSRLVLATLLFEGLHIWFDGRMTLWPSAPGWVIAGLFTVALFLLADATK